MESLSSLANETNLVVMTTALLTSEIENNGSTLEISTGSCNSSTSGWELNSTEQVTSPPPSDQDGKIPVIGYPGPLFTAIHVAALTSLSLSTVCVTILLVYLCGISGSVKEPIRPTTVNGKTAVQKKKAKLPFWKWNVGERYVVYLSVCDLLQGISHFLDHAYMFYAKDNPPDRICAAFAFFLHEFILTQWFIILATALSACSLIVFGRKISLGRYDWRLFAFALGIPTFTSVTAAGFGLLGAGGAWCFIKYGAPSWLLYAQIVNTTQICFFGLVGVAYGAIWIKIQRTTKLMKGSTTERYQSSAKVMMIFVAVFILQWWTFALYTVWNMVSVPPPIVFILAVTFINLGGIYNSIAYTIIRRKLQQQKRQNAVVSNGGEKVTNTTAAKSSRAIQRTVSAPRVVHPTGGLRAKEVQDVLPDVVDIPSDVRNDPGVGSLVKQAWSVPIVPGVSQIVQMVGEGQRPVSDADQTQDAGRIQIHIHI